MPIQTAIDSINNNQGSPFGFKNRIINGAMVINQRGASVTSSGYTVDRFQYVASLGSKGTLAQSTTVYPTGFEYSLGFTSSSSYSVGPGESFTINQTIEGYNIADLEWGTSNAETVTLSFWVYSSLGPGTFGGSLSSYASTRSHPFTYTISAANTWEKKSITIIGDKTGTWYSDINAGMNVWFGLGVGTTNSGPAGAWASSAYYSATSATSVVAINNATFYITGVQLEKGSTASPFDYRSFGTELIMCQRYFEKSYQYANAVGSSGTGNTGQILYIGTGNSIANGDKIPNTTFKVVKRTAPDILVWSPNGTSNRLANMAGTDLAAGSCTPNVANDSSFFAYQNSGGSVSGTAGCVQFQWSASAEL
jgi:hypothetical protein